MDLCKCNPWQSLDRVTENCPAVALVWNLYKRGAFVHLKWECVVWCGVHAYTLFQCWNLFPQHWSLVLLSFIQSQCFWAALCFCLLVLYIVWTYVHVCSLCCRSHSCRQWQQHELRKCFLPALLVWLAVAKGWDLQLQLSLAHWWPHLKTFVGLLSYDNATTCCFILLMLIEAKLLYNISLIDWLGNKKQPPPPKKKEKKERKKFGRSVGNNFCSVLHKAGSNLFCLLNKVLPDRAVAKHALIIIVKCQENMSGRERNSDTSTASYLHL